LKYNNLYHFKIFPEKCDIFLRSLSVFAAFAYFFLCVLCVKSFNEITFTSPALEFGPDNLRDIFRTSHAIISERYIYKSIIMQNLKSTENQQIQQKSTEIQKKINYEFSKNLQNPPPACITILKLKKNQLRSTVDFK